MVRACAALGAFALSAGLLIAARGASGAPSGTVVWQTGGGRLGQYALPNGFGQCPGVGPVIRGRDASFTVLRNRKGTYSYERRRYTGASTCYRNQMSPLDPETGNNFLLKLGRHYTFTFETVVRFNGNYRFQGTAEGGLAVDVPAIVWQTHTLNEVPPPDDKGGPCALLVIQNTYRASQQGLKLYGTVEQGGLPTWNFHTCDESDFTGRAYNSPDTLHDGQLDRWQFDIVAQVQPHEGGSIVVRRNGRVVYDRPGAHICDDTTPNCWWNFGAYMIYWENSEEPPGWNDAGFTIEVNKMTLVQH